MRGGYAYQARKQTTTSKQASSESSVPSTRNGRRVPCCEEGLAAHRHGQSGPIGAPAPVRLVWRAAARQNLRARRVRWGVGLRFVRPRPATVYGQAAAPFEPNPRQPKAGARGAVAAWIHLLELRVGTILDDIVQFALARRYRQVRDPCERGTVCVSPLAGAGGRQFAARRPSQGGGARPEAWPRIAGGQHGAPRHCRPGSQRGAAPGADTSESSGMQLSSDALGARCVQPYYLYRSIG